MKVVHKGTGTDILSKVPTPPAYLDASAKRHYKAIAKSLITAEVLKQIHLKPLEILADYSSQFEWAC